MSAQQTKLRRMAEQRADKMIYLRDKKGLTLDAIGVKYGVSRQRVHEIIKWRRES